MTSKDGRAAAATTTAVGERLGSGAILEIALVVALVTGALEVITRLVDPVRIGLLFTWQPRWFVWQAPAGLILAFGLWSIPLVVAALLFRPLARARIVLGYQLFPFFLTLDRLFIRRLELYAGLILAAGLAAAAGRLLGRFVERGGPWRLVARSLAGLIAALIALGAGLTALDGQGRGAKPRPAAGARSVILVTLDTVRAENMSFQGYERPTMPELGRFAEEGTVFTNAFAPSSWTLPSHASLFTGLWPEETGTGWSNPLSPEPTTLAEDFLARGYDTAGFVANLGYCSARTGLDRGFETYRDYPLDLGSTLVATQLGRLVLREWHKRFGDPRTAGNYRKLGGRVTDEFLSWLDERSGDRPFFVFLNYFDAHLPYVTPAPFATAFRRDGKTKDERLVARLAARTSADMFALMDGYDGALLYLDAELARLFAALRERGLLDETLVVVTSDHGETFAEHRASGHGRSLYQETLHVPLVMRLPGLVPAGRRVDRAVTLRDLPRTIATLARPEGEEAADLPGGLIAVTAAGAAEGEASPIYAHLERGVWVGREDSNHAGAVRSLHQDGFHLVVHEDPARPDELYDLSRDPFERDDLARDEAQAGRLAAMRARLDEILSGLR